MISATVMTAQTTINIIIGDIRHLGSGEPAPCQDGSTAIANPEGASRPHYKHAQGDCCKFLIMGAHQCYDESTESSRQRWVKPGGGVEHPTYTAHSGYCPIW